MGIGFHESELLLRITKSKLPNTVEVEIFSVFECIQIIAAVPGALRNTREPYSKHWTNALLNLISPKSSKKETPKGHMETK